MAKDLKIIIDPITGKRGLSLKNGTLETVSGAEEAAQRIKVALNTILGEYAFDLLKGLPLFDQIFRRTQYENLILGYYRQGLLAVHGIKTVQELSIERGEQRNYNLNFSVLYQDNTVITGVV